MDKVVHFEIPADDMSRAKNFYITVFGWGINDVPEMHYTMVTTTKSNEQGMPQEPGGINGGLMDRKEGMKTPTIYVDVQDIDAALAKVKENGGTVLHEKMSVGAMGFVAHFNDSEGNVIGLWQAVKK